MAACSASDETWRCDRASWYGDDSALGDRTRVPSGVNSSGFFTTMRLCVGVKNLRGVRSFLFDVGVPASSFLLFFGQIVKCSNVNLVEND